MPKVDFDQFSYYPSLQCGDGEHIGYRKLSNADKAKFLPVFQISQHGDDASFESSFKQIQTSAEKRPFILDFCRDRMQPPALPQKSKDPQAAKALYDSACVTYSAYNSSYSKIMNSADGYANWRATVGKFPNAVPTIIFNEVSQKQILKQAMMLSRVSESLAIRISKLDDPKIYPIVSQIGSYLESPDRLLVILDAGYARQNTAKGVTFAIEGIEQITQEMDAAEKSFVRAVFMSSSFPHPSFSGVESIDNLERNAWKAALEYFPFKFGDYAGMYRHPLVAIKPRGWRASVVFPMAEEWLVYRHGNAKDKSGWSAGAKAISVSDHFKNDVPNVWGVQSIAKAAKGNLEGLDWPRDWYGVKVNVHLHRQANYAPPPGEEYEGDDE